MDARNPFPQISRLVQPDDYEWHRGRRKPKPDWVVYYDEGDTISIENVIAERIAGHLPEFEWGEMNGGPMRGLCILVYSPMNTSPSPQDKRWTLDEKHFSFHMTELAREQYDDHDDHMHRVFGDLIARHFIAPIEYIYIYNPMKQ